MEHCSRNHDIWLNSEQICAQPKCLSIERNNGHLCLKKSEFISILQPSAEEVPNIGVSVEGDVRNIKD